MGDELKGKVALVTGAARGLGLVVVHDLAKEGMHVVGADVLGELLTKEMTRVAERFGIRTMAVPTDISQEDQIKALVRRADEAFGRIDVLVNNAGIRQLAPVWKTDTEMWDRIQNANLKGHFICTREVLAQRMLEQREGTIVFVSSGSGKQGEEDSSAYCASKWGLIGFAESVAKDLKKTRIRVTVVTPGRIATPMAHESKNWGVLEYLDPAHVSAAIVYCIKQDPNTIIPEIRTYHRAQL